MTKKRNKARKKVHHKVVRKGHVRSGRKAVKRAASSQNQTQGLNEEDNIVLEKEGIEESDQQNYVGESSSNERIVGSNDGRSEVANVPEESMEEWSGESKGRIDGEANDEVIGDKAGDVKVEKQELPKMPVLKTLAIKSSIKMKERPILRRSNMSEKDIAMDFAMKVQKKFDRLVKSSILFGSQATAKDNAVEGSDIDIILIVDDAAVEWDLELVSWYREELGKLVASQDYGRELHINTVRLVTWWEDMIHGDPIVINILRYGEALIGYGGFFNPLKALLLKGNIRSTPEAVYSALQRAPWHIARSKGAQMGAIEGVYWAMIDSAHAALMTAGKLPPSPEHVPEMLRETFVDAGMLKMSYVKTLREVYYLHKSISHGNVSSVKGQEIDEWQELAERFLGEMTRIIDSLLEKK